MILKKSIDEDQDYVNLQFHSVWVNILIYYQCQLFCPNSTVLRYELFSPPLSQLSRIFKILVELNTQTRTADKLVGE